MTSDPRSHLPLKPVELALLLALAEQERHGYGLVQAIAESSAQVIKLEPGNLYRVIKRLMSGGLVAESERRPAPDLSDERRRYYRITPLGGRVLALELARLKALVDSVPVRALARRWAT